VATDWVTISSLATAGGTLALAISTFSAVRSANRAARVAEQALLVGVRPLLLPSRLGDGMQKIYFVDGKRVTLPGGFGAAEVDADTVYLAISLRNSGRGIGVVHGWRFEPGRPVTDEPPNLADFRPQTRDLYISPSDIGFWQGAFRDDDDPLRPGAIKAIAAREMLTIDVLYGDYEGGQRAITRFALQHVGDQPQHQQEGRPPWLASAVLHWSLDRPEPRDVHGPSAAALQHPGSAATWPSAGR
jgi:hypothetical protein